MKLASILVAAGLIAGRLSAAQPPATPGQQQPFKTQSAETQTFKAQTSETKSSETKTSEKQIFDQLNADRAKAGLPTLEWSDRVAEAARRHAAALLENGQLSHQFPGEPSLPERLGATGIRFTSAAENVARTGFVEDVHLALMNSPGHRANILSPKYNAVGIGLVEHEGKIYVTQDFAFLVPQYSEAEFSAAFAETLNRERKRKRGREIDVRPDTLLRELACATNGSAGTVADKVSGVRAVVVFTLSEPHGLPEQMLARATDPEFQRVNVGVCFRPDQQHGYANFWVVAAFYAR